ncbi:MAG: PadR family transcriptional regulator [Anaerolineales bacterium]
MPGGRGYGMGKGRRRGQRKMFFLQSCLLVLLHREPGYGYSLMDGLQEFGFQPDQMDISIIYRALRNLEEDDLVSDSWDDNSLGPQRRVYTLTPQGEEALAEWIENLRQRRKEIEALEKAYDAIKNK